MCLQRYIPFYIALQALKAPFGRNRSKRRCNDHSGINMLSKQFRENDFGRNAS